MAEAVDYGNTGRALEIAELLMALFMLPERVDVSAGAREGGTKSKSRGEEVRASRRL
jgi:hypothetical protein